MASSERAGGAGGAARHSIIRILSKKGLCSRKQAVELVAAGRVRLNGRVVTRPGELASLADSVEVDGKPLAGRARVYLMLHKPAGCVTTRSDERGRDTVYRWLEGVSEWVAPVGRLDKDTEGLLLFTNDSRFSDRLLDPRNAVPRTYRVTVDAALGADELAAVAPRNRHRPRRTVEALGDPRRRARRGRHVRGHAHRGEEPRDPTPLRGL